MRPEWRPAPWWPQGTQPPFCHLCSNPTLHGGHSRDSVLQTQGQRLKERCLSAGVLSPTLRQGCPRRATERGSGATRASPAIPCTWGDKCERPLESWQARGALAPAQATCRSPETTEHRRLHGEALESPAAENPGADMEDTERQEARRPGGQGLHHLSQHVSQEWFQERSCTGQ